MAGRLGDAAVGTIVKIKVDNKLITWRRAKAAR